MSPYFLAELLGLELGARLGLPRDDFCRVGWERSAELAAALFGLAVKPNTEGPHLRSALGACALPTGNAQARPGH